MNSSLSDVLIVGAGVCGLTAARYLKTTDFTVQLVDKGRGVGGRMATRRLAQGHADHGTPCLQTDDKDVYELWREPLSSVTLRPAPVQLDAQAFVCPDGINQVAKALADGLPITLEETITELSYSQQIWTARSKSGSVYQARHVLVTCPLIQASQLFSLFDQELAQRLLAKSRDVSYLPQWTGIVSLDPCSLPDNSPTDYETFEGLAIRSIHKQLADRTWVVHMSQEFTLSYLEQDPAEVASLMRTALMEMDIDMKQGSVQAHRWRYARIRHPLRIAYLHWDDRPSLYFAGDFCLGSQVSLAAKSGLAAARALVGH